MIMTAVINAILALGVFVMVVTPLVWAIVTQHHDHPRRAAADGATVRRTEPRKPRHVDRPEYKPVVGRA
ncbi:MAG TPA: hypothetical protein VLO10_02170 [Candidatus Deferrimicrobium sp.]|nr:hypothetical protein [Candidatus Deferrimicrobium sp.]